MKKSVVLATVAAFVLGGAMVSSAATIEALNVGKRNIPIDPTDLFWSPYGPTKGKGVVIDMDPQMITNPMWPNPATKWVNVKAARNDKEIAIRLEWNDGVRNDIMVRSQHYKDQAALMFPVKEGSEPPFTMGSEGERVNIWQWKATWDKEGAGRAGNEGMQDLEDYYADMALGAGGYYMYEPDGNLALKGALKPGMSGSKDERSKEGVHTGGAGDIVKRSTFVDLGMGKNEGVYNPGRATHNIMSDASMRRSPVEDLNAEGFSTLTTQANQDVDGEGNWNNDRWAVVFKRPLKTEDANDVQFTGNSTPMSIAIWNGANKERNGQKAITAWNTLKY
ncbi:ethylbenzene dehydrogenase-related protein [Nitrospina gracilis]|uniref:ethylbenzene dehydrogenase-related protein n=1 Tax=Nitrospina gracilis TaxID=35801 RepID=UPI001F0115C3|nr:ethylbenzene dehydrogenase-related protein [Nitrospina gracilis]MCF8719918.1 DMSO reductase family type II enzyme heme b subunit [Nitrospina gracilis Nb-211]